jgi:mandelate racemase
VTLPKLTFRDLTVRAVEVPIRRPLVSRIVTLERAALLLLDLATEEGPVGRSYLFGYLRRGSAYMAPVLRDLALQFKGAPLAPAELYQRANKALSLMGHQGIATMAVSGLDVACWDALARAAGLPLARLLGGRPRELPAYNSNGLGIIAPDAAAEEAQALLAEGGFRAVKVRVGRPTLEADLAAFRAIRRAVGDAVLLPVDFNQCLTTVEAIRRGRALDGEGVYWIEEPIPYDDLASSAKIAREVATPIQIGESLYGPRAIAEAIQAQAADYLMPDLQRVGGVTGWLRAAALCEAAGIEMSSHLFPEVSAHLLTVTPTAHWLEYVDWAAPILARPLEIRDGHAIIRDEPGNGLAWDEAAVTRYAVEL